MMNLLRHWLGLNDRDPIFWTIVALGTIALYLLVFCFVPALNTMFGTSIPPGYLWCPKAFHDSRCAD